jgi:hypothetical protein
MERKTRIGEIEYWVSDDGKQQGSESLVKYYEEALLHSRISKEMKQMKVLDIPETGSLWTFIANKEQLNYVKGEHHNCYPSAELLKVGDWFTVFKYWDDDGDQRERIYSLRYVLDRVKKFIEDVEEITVEGMY